jgi:hypothetical protein
MKALLVSLFMISSAFAQDSAEYLKNFDSKIYSLKSKGVDNFVVDIRSSKITKQLNDQQIFGKVEDVIFRTYWTAKPERLAIEIVGLPEGFKEVKDDLKGSILTVVENLIPPTFAQQFNGYKFTAGSKPKEILANDPSGLAAVPSFTLKFDKEDKLIETVANKPIGTLVMKPDYEKESFAEGKWVLKELVTTASENGQSMKVTKELSYSKVSGIGVLSEVELTVEQSGMGENAKPVSKSDTVEFKNYKINDGEALKYFLGEVKVVAPPATMPKITPKKK